MDLGYSTLKRYWMWAVPAVVLAVGSFSIYRLHGVFGSGDDPTATRTRVDEIKSTNPKQVTYEVFGAPHTHGVISYLDESAQPREAHFSSLPWSFSLITTAPSVLANLIAEGDDATLGCRILVDGNVRDVHVFNDHDAMAFCLVKAA